MSKKKYIGLEDIDKINQENNKKLKKEKKSIFEKFSTKENIIIFSFLLIFLIIGWELVQRYDSFDNIDYRKVNSTTFISNSITENDRDTYWILNDILLNFLHSGTFNNISNNGEGSESNLNYKFSTDEYYEALTNDYKKYIDKEKYLNLANQVIDKYKNNYEVLTTVTNEVPIRKVYKYNDSDYYIVKLNTSIDTYIGIQLIKENTKFKIFYLE